MIKIEVSNVKSKIQIKLIAFIKYTYFYISMQNLGIEFERTRATINNWIKFVTDPEKIKYEVNVHDIILADKNSIKILEKNGIYIIEVYRYIKIRQDIRHDLKLNLTNGIDIAHAMTQTKLKKSRLYEIKQKYKNNKDSQYNKINENSIIALINKILRYCTDKRYDDKEKSYQCIINRLDYVGFSQNAIYHILSRLEYGIDENKMDENNTNKKSLGEIIVLYIYYRLNFAEKEKLIQLVFLQNKKYLDSFIKQKLDQPITNILERIKEKKEDLYDSLIVESKYDDSDVLAFIKNDMFTNKLKSIGNILKKSNIHYTFGGKNKKITLGHLLVLIRDKNINILQLYSEYIMNIKQPKNYIPVYNSKLIKSKQQHIPKSFISKYVTKKKYNIHYSNKYNKFIYKDFYDLDFHLKSRKYEPISD